MLDKTERKVQRSAVREKVVKERGVRSLVLLFKGKNEADLLIWG